MPKALKVKIETLHTALEKVRKYCVYQERSQQEVRNKFYSLGLPGTEVEQGIVVLIEEGFVNEERFSIAYARGKFRIKNWGRVKIRAALKGKLISDWAIKNALAKIDDTEYLKTLKSVLESRARKVKETNPLKKNYLLAKYASSQGFEPDLVWDVLRNEMV